MIFINHICSYVLERISVDRDLRFLTSWLGNRGLLFNDPTGAPIDLGLAIIEGASEGI